MREMGNWQEYFTKRLADNREAAIDYLRLTFEEYQDDGDLSFFLKGLRTFIASQGGVSELSKRTGIAHETLSQLLSSEHAPRLDMLRTLLNALECQLSLEPLTGKNTKHETTEAAQAVHPIPLDGGYI